MADSTGHKAIGDRFASLEFFANYVHHSSPLAHLWSISCEMQFYLVSPLLFWLGTRAGLTLVWLGKRTYSIYLVQ